VQGRLTGMAEELALDTQEQNEGESRTRTDWWGEARGIFWLVLAVLGFHSLVAKPFYIPSESMMPALLVGDRLVVTKYPYGYSYVTPTFHVLPFIQGRLFGSVPQRGDIVIVTPPDARTDYIKRVIGLPGETIEMHGGIVYINGRPVQRGLRRGHILGRLRQSRQRRTQRRHGRAVVGNRGHNQRGGHISDRRATVPDGNRYRGQRLLQQQHHQLGANPGHRPDRFLEIRTRLERHGIGRPRLAQRRSRRRGRHGSPRHHRRKRQNNAGDKCHP